MQCVNKIKAGFTESGDLTFSPKKASKSIVGFEFECRKCLPCRLNIAREKALRAIHEAQMNGDKNIFLTLTYSDQHLKSPRLCYKDFQLFMYKLRDHVTRNVQDPDLKKSLAISLMVTGEYGDKNKRPHWHALLFNYRPSDETSLRQTDRGDRVYTSKTLSDLWGKGNIEYGEVTLDSAGYTARYAAKKLVHGKDGDHDYHPIHKTSSRNAIGKRWIEKYWKQTFDLGFVYLPNGQKTKIPRYYTEWLKKNHPDEWRRYVTNVRQEAINTSSQKARKEELEFFIELINLPHGSPRPYSRNKVKLTILQQKFDKLQKRLKL